MWPLLSQRDSVPSWPSESFHSAIKELQGVSARQAVMEQEGPTWISSFRSPVPVGVTAFSCDILDSNP